MNAAEPSRPAQKGRAVATILTDRIAQTRLMPWAAEQGPGANAPLRDDGVFLVDTSVEGEWLPRHPSGVRPDVVNIVDGVRRVEAYAMSDTVSGTVAPGLFGSYAAGVVRCEPGYARIPTDREFLRVARCYLQSGTAAEDLVVLTGEHELRYRAAPVPGATRPSDLANELTMRMLDAEAHLTEKLSTETSALTLVDGPLRRLHSGWRVVGYIKRTKNWYLGSEERAIFDDLGVGDRTPLFRLARKQPTEGRPPVDRLSWYVRIADLGPHLHPLSSLMRMETWATLPVTQAAQLADECAAILPRMASSLVHDPRAPQNLTPVRGLEKKLHRILGDRRWLRRRIAVALAQRAPGASIRLTESGRPS